MKSILSKLIKKQVELITIRNKIGYIDNGEYEMKITYKILGIIIKQKIIK